MLNAVLLRMSRLKGLKGESIRVTHLKKRNDAVHLSSG